MKNPFYSIYYRTNVELIYVSLEKEVINPLFYVFALKDYKY